MKFEESLQAGHHARLKKLEGSWEGTTRTWFEPNVLADESPVTGSIRPVLNGRFMLHEYKGSLTGKPFEGMAIIGYDLNTGKFQIAWIDSFHMSTAIMFSESTNNDSFSVLGSYAAGEEKWGWRTAIEFKTDDELVITAFNITPAGEEAKAVETTYKRSFNQITPELLL